MCWVFSMFAFFLGMCLACVQKLDASFIGCILDTIACVQKLEASFIGCIFDTVANVVLDTCNHDWMIHGSLVARAVATPRSFYRYSDYWAYFISTPLRRDLESAFLMWHCLGLCVSSVSASVPATSPEWRAWCHWLVPRGLLNLALRAVTVAGARVGLGSTVPFLVRAEVPHA